MITDARELWLIQLRLECKTIDADGRLVRIAGPNPDDIPTCAVTRFPDEYVVSFAATADPAFVEQARTVPPETLFNTPSCVGQLTTARYSTYVFPQITQLSDPTVTRSGPEEYVVTVAGREVSWASSSRSNDEAAELWVRTAEEARGNGFAQRAATAWAAEVLTSGRIPFYSHHADNTLSRHLAHKLHTTPTFDLLAITT